MQENERKICTICNQEIKEQDSVISCKTCGRSYHQNCWEKNGGCPQCVGSNHAESTSAAAFCPNCGTPLEAGAVFCPRCGKQVAAEMQQPVPGAVQPPVIPVYAAPGVVTASGAGKKKKLILGIVIGLVAVLMAFVLVMVLVQEGQKNALRKEFMGEWNRAKGSIILVLDIDEDTIVYRAETMFESLNSTIGEMHYEPISGDTIRIEGMGEFKIEFVENEETSTEGMVTTPSFVDTDSQKIWVRA